AQCVEAWLACQSGEGLDAPEPAGWPHGQWSCRWRWRAAGHAPGWWQCAHGFSRSRCVGQIHRPQGLDLYRRHQPDGEQCQWGGVQHQRHSAYPGADHHSQLSRRAEGESGSRPYQSLSGEADAGRRSRHARSRCHIHAYPRHARGNRLHLTLSWNSPDGRLRNMKLNTVEEIIEDIRQGKMVILMDDEDRENEGDLVIAAECVRTEDINFMATYARGLICLTLSKERC